MRTRTGMGRCGSRKIAAGAQNEMAVLTAAVMTMMTTVPTLIGTLRGPSGWATELVPRSRSRVTVLDPQVGEGT